MLEGYQSYSFSAPMSNGAVATHDVYFQGELSGSACIVIIQELPGIGKETLDLARFFVEQGFSVALPHLFGPLGRTSLLGNTARVFCMRKAFKLFEKNASSPIVDWLRALCGDLRQRHGVGQIGAIGMCLTGNFAISMMVDEHVSAGVASQPSMPLGKHDALHMSAQDVAEIRDSLDHKGTMLALRFAEDPLCRAEKFTALDAAFNDDAQRIKLVTLPGKGHSVLTLDLIKGGEPAQAALQEVLTYFRSALAS